MSEMITITGAEALDGYRLRITFSDHAIKEIDLSDLIGSARGVFRALGDPRTFKSVRVNSETGTVEWPGEVDLDPEVLYGLYEPASGALIKRRTIREPASV
jgi:Protein of unknown function (DUF2442)